MKQLFLFLYCFWGGILSLSAQDFQDYQPLVCKGLIPSEYITPSIEKYKNEIQRLKEKQVRGKQKRGMKEFALLSNFWEDDLLQSGYVLFNDPLSEYVREVFAQLTAAEPQWRDHVRIYTLRTAEVNAFASDRGNIFITLGMLAQLEDEAQLAYILAHELVHFQEKHALDLFLESKNFKKGASAEEVLGRTVFEDADLARHHYSRDLETLADQRGLEIFLRTNYATHTLSTVYDVLRYGYLPFDDIPFDFSMLETEWYKLPQTLKLDTVNMIRGIAEDADDSRSSHPNLFKRRIMLEEGLTGVSHTGRQLFLVSEEGFRKARELARFELPQLYLESGRLSDAIYAAFLLKSSYPGNKYLDKVIAKALYRLVKYKNDIQFVYQEKKHDEVEGESQRLYYLVYNIPAKDATVMALRYVWSIYRTYPDDPELASLIDDLFLEFSRHFTALSAFYSSPVQVVPDTANVEEPDPAQPSKYDKIRRQKKARASLGEYWRSALIDCVADSSFIASFEKNRDEYLRRKEKDEYFATREGKRELARLGKKVRRRGLELGIPRIVLVNPYFVRLNARKDNEEMLLPTAMGQENYRELIREIAPKTNLDIRILDVDELKEDQTDQFNDIRLLNTWFEEQIRHFDLSLTPGASQDRINALADKYKTDYFLWTGVLSVRQDILSELDIRTGLTNMLLQSLQPRNAVMIYAILFDIRTGRREVIKFNYFRRMETDTLLKAHLYDVFSQISAGRRG